MPPTHQLDYATGRRAKFIVIPLMLPGIVAGLIWALHELAIEPYRPPYDMTTS